MTACCIPPETINLGAWMTRRGRFLSEKTTLYNFGADVCHMNLAAFVKKTCRVVVPCNDIYHLCPDLTFILDVSPSNSSASIALSLSAQTGRAPPASHGNGCPYWEPLQNARSIKCVEDYQEFGFPSLISGTPPCIQHGVNCKMYFFIFNRSSDVTIFDPCFLSFYTSSFTVLRVTRRSTD